MSLLTGDSDLSEAAAMPSEKRPLLITTYVTTCVRL
jgi:hypothetical protein